MSFSLLLFWVGIALLGVAEGKPSLDERAIELQSNGTGRSFVDALRQVTLPFVIKQLGMIECAGLGHTLGTDFFERVMGPGADFGGDYLCQPTCAGQCVPTEGLGQAPKSLYYPFGCRCSRCDKNGPIITDLIKPQFKVICVEDPRCTCESMGPRGTHTGYLCNWINLTTQLPISFIDPSKPVLSGYPPEKSPIRWCSCCPNDLRATPY